MKLLLEKWNKFIKEKIIKEAEPDEIGMLDDMMEIPIEKYPFKEVFGDRYRLIEPISLAKEDTVFGVSMNSLEKLGWTVNKPQDGKMLCTKIKISHKIDGQGQVIISRIPVSLNITKVVNGIINFVENKRERMRDEHAKTIKKIAERIITTPEDTYNSEDNQGRSFKPDSDLNSVFHSFLYELSLDGFKGFDNSINNYTKATIRRVPILLTTEEYRKLYRFIDAQSYWTNMERPYDRQTFIQRLDSYYNFDLNKMKAFKKEHLDTNFEDLVTNIDKYYNKYYIIYSRHPIDVFRMSDHEAIKSCHDLPSNYGKEGRYYDEEFPTGYTKHGKWVEYSVCALAEALGNGMIAYAVPAEEFHAFPPTQESLDEEAEAEIFYDDKRGVGYLEPTSRIRIKHVSYRPTEKDEPMRIAVPETKGYPVTIPNFGSKVLNKMASLQKNRIKDIIDTNNRSIDLENFTRYGGEQQDNSVSSLLPKLFRFVGKDLTFSGTPRYNRDIQDALEQDIGQKAEEYIRDVANDVFDSNTVWPFEWLYSVEEDYDGEPSLDFKLHITFNIPKLNIPKYLRKHLKDSPQKSRESYHKAITELIKYELKDDFEMPNDFEVYIRAFNDTEEVKIVYSGRNLVDMNYSSDINELEQMIDSVFEEGPRLGYIFDRFDQQSYNNTLIHYLQKKGFIHNENYILHNIFTFLDRDMRYAIQGGYSTIEFNTWGGDITLVDEDYHPTSYLEKISMYGEETLWVDEIFEELSGVSGKEFDIDNEQHFLLARAIYGAISSLHYSDDENMFYRIINSIDSDMENNSIRFELDYDKDHLRQNLYNIIKNQSGLEIRFSVDLDQNKQDEESMFNVAHLIHRYTAGDMIDRTKEVLIALLKKQFGNLNERRKRVNIKILKGK